MFSLKHLSAIFTFQKITLLGLQY